LYSEELFPSTAWTAGDQINKCIVESAQFDECAALLFLSGDMHARVENNARKCG
jgi:hypothetical protein